MNALCMAFNQSNEVKGSYHMEKEGLHRCLSFLKEHDLDVAVLVTDRHKQINKWLRDKHSGVKHYYDIWHVAKGTYSCNNCHANGLHIITHIPDLSAGFRKKLEKLAKQKGCELVCEWQKSIINHLYWCVSSSSNDDGNNDELVKAKWLSLDNHVHNVHKKHSKEFPKCLHGRLRGRDKKKKWFKRRK